MSINLPHFYFSLHPSSNLPFAWVGWVLFHFLIFGTPFYPHFAFLSITMFTPPKSPLDSTSFPYFCKKMLQEAQDFFYFRPKYRFQPLLVIFFTTNNITRWTSNLKRIKAKKQFSTKLSKKYIPTCKKKLKCSCYFFPVCCVTWNYYSYFKKTHTSTLLQQTYA